MIIQIAKWVYKISFSFNEKVTNNFFVKFMAYFIGTTLINYVGMFIVVLTW